MLINGWINDMENVAVHELNNVAIDWQKIKEILQGINSYLKLICQNLPAGAAKDIVCGISALISLLINVLPSIK